MTGMKIQYTEIRDRLVDKFSYSYRNPSALGNTGFICTVVNDILFDAGLRPIKSYMIIPELFGRLYGGDRNFMYNPMDENLFDGVEETTPESGLIEFYQTGIGYLSYLGFDMSDRVFDIGYYFDQYRSPVTKFIRVISRIGLVTQILDEEPAAWFEI